MKIFISTETTLKRPDNNEQGAVSRKSIRPLVFSELDIDKLDVVTLFNFLDQDLLHHLRVFRINREISLLFTTAFIL